MNKDIFFHLMPKVVLWSENELECHRLRRLSLKFLCRNSGGITHTQHTLFPNRCRRRSSCKHFSSAPPLLPLLSSSPSRFSLSQINASESSFGDISDVCVSRKEGVLLITRQGTLISDGNIWFTLSWRDSCIKSRNYPNQFKLHPPPSPPPCFTSLHIKLPH